MAIRAIRHDKIDYKSNHTLNDALHWIRYRHDDTEIRQPLMEACQYQITHAGDSAQDYQQTINDMNNQLHYTTNYYQGISQVYAHLIPHLINLEMQNHGLDSFMLKKLTEMRDYAKANATTHPHYGSVHFDGRSDQTYMDIFHALTQEMTKVADAVNTKYFPSPNQSYGNRGIVQVAVNYGIVGVETTDEHIENWVNIQSGNWGHIWRNNSHYFLTGGHGQNNVHTYPSIPADIMEGFMDSLIAKQPMVALMIAKNDQMFIDNPHAKSIGHSWTSRNRSDDCWFKVEADKVNKMNTTVFAPPRTFFGKHTPVFADMVKSMDGMKADILQFLTDIEPVLKHKKDAKQALQDKTDKSAEVALISIVQGLLDDPATVEIGTAIVGNIAGIATLPIDLSNCPQYPNGTIQYTYHDFERKEDVITHLYPHYLKDVVPLTALTITDEVQGKLYHAYQKELESHRTHHANRCAQLARQIAQTTTRHDAEVAVITEAFTAYQTQV